MKGGDLEAVEAKEGEARDVKRVVRGRPTDWPDSRSFLRRWQRRVGFLGRDPGDIPRCLRVLRRLYEAQGGIGRE